MENPIKNSKDFFNQEDYDRLVKEGVTEFAEYSSLPVPPDVALTPSQPKAVPTVQPSRPSSRPSSPPPIVNPNVAPIPTQRGSTSRRDFIWGLVSIGVGATILGGAVILTRPRASELAPPKPRLSPGLTESPIVSTRVPTATRNLRPAEAAAPPTQAPTATANLRPVEAAALPTRTPVLAKPEHIIRPTQTPTPDPLQVFREAFPDIYPSKENRKPGTSTIDQAKQIMGNDFLGPESIRNAFKIGIRSEDIPAIPFDVTELQKARELQQFLILRTNRLADGSDLTILRMEELLQKEFFDTKRGWILRNAGVRFMNRGGHKVEIDTAEKKWALVTKGLLEGSTNDESISGGIEQRWSIALLRQVHSFAKYVKETIFRSQNMSEEYNKAIYQYDAHKPDILYYIPRGNYDQVWRKIYNLEINKLFRHRPVELVYDLLMYEQNRNNRLLLNDLSATIMHPESGIGFLSVGRFNPGGIMIGLGDGLNNSVSNADRNASYGVLFTRS